MSLPIALAMRDRIEAQVLEAGSPLHVWAQTYERTPHVVLGYRRPAVAEGWPFVAIVPHRDKRDLKKRRGLEATVSLVFGYLQEDAERADADGIMAVDGLAEAAIAAISLPWSPQWGDAWYQATAGERVDGAFSRPNYELELRIGFGLRTIG